jgi:protein arginine kinase activator
VNIHGENSHVGKRPKTKSHGTDRITELIRLRRELKEAIEKEEYELASQIRDQIRKFEKEGGDEG